MRKCFIAIVMLILLSTSCFAASVSAPATIIVQQEQKQVSISITNSSDAETAEYQVGFSGLFESVLTPSSGNIAAGETVSLALTIMPDERLEGSSYDIVLEASVGEEKIFKNIRVIFKEAVKEGAGEETTSEGNTALFSLAGIGSGIGMFFSFENVLNIVLIVAAAILLIAFIARFVKRLEAPK